MKGKLEKIFNGICAIVLIWLVLSFVDVNIHNLGDQQYAWWNLFVLIFE